MKQKNRFFIYPSVIMGFALMLSFIFKAHAQNYLINFIATGDVTTLDSVKVENHTQGTSLTINGGDILNLTGATGIYNTDSNDEMVTICPNPMQGQAEVSFYAKNAGNAQFLIYDILGKEILQISNYLSKGIQKYQIAGFNKGMYFIIIKGENYSYLSKVISLNTIPGKTIIQYLGSETSETNKSILKKTKATISMAYTNGDNMHYTGYSGIYYIASAYDIPTSSKSITFYFGALDLGVSYQGGIIAYILQPGDIGYDPIVQHGLIIAPTNQSTGIQWYNGTSTNTGAKATAIGTGNANTNTIVNSQGPGSYAAKLCYDLVLGGYSDWYLPSDEELHMFFLNQNFIGGFANSKRYWSSSEYNDIYSAWTYYFDGFLYGAYSHSSDSKSNANAVRAVRSF